MPINIGPKLVVVGKAIERIARNALMKYQANEARERIQEGMKDNSSTNQAPQDTSPTVPPSDDASATKALTASLTELYQHDRELQQLVQKHWRPLHDPLDDLDKPRKPETRQAVAELGDYVLRKLPMPQYRTPPINPIDPSTPPGRKPLRDILGR